MLIIAVSFAVGLVATCLGCSPPIGGFTATTLDWKMMNSQVVGHGVVLNRQEDPRFTPYGSVYSVTFELRCIYKGGILDELIRIVEVGTIPGHCISTNLTTNEKYLVYLRSRDDGSFVQEFSPDPGESEYLDEILVLCETTVTYPRGRDELNYREKCPEMPEESDCLPQPVHTEPPPPTDGAGHDASTPPGEGGEPQPEGPQKQGNEVPYQPVVGEGTIQGNDDDGRNSSGTLTLHISAFISMVVFASLL